MRLFSIALTPAGGAGALARIEREAQPKPSRDLALRWRGAGDALPGKSSRLLLKL